MEHRSKPSFWDRDELLETVKETYQQLQGEYIPLSRAICCRPCLPPGTATLPGVSGNLSSSGAVVAIASDCQASTKGGSGGAPSSASSGASANVKGQACPAGGFVQGFQHDVRANPSAAAADQYYYPVDHAQCCSPRLLLTHGGEELPVERCHCTQQSAPYSVGCGATNTPESAAAAGSLVWAFDNELTAMGAYGRSLEVPVTPVRCCKACVSPNAKPAMDDCAALSFCRGNGDCTVDGHCECNQGWIGPDCGKVDGDGDPMHQTMWNAAKIAAVKACIKAHQGARAFHWTPPLGAPGLYVTTGGWRLSGHGAQKYTLSTTFEQTFHP